MGSPVVVVTGASEGGIGYALCEAFDARGCKVYATARSLSALASLPASVQKLALDVTDAQSCTSVISTIIEREARIDILVNNAGRGGTGALLDFSVEEGKETFEVNLWGAVRMTQGVIGKMAERKKGLIVNIGSVVGLIPTPWAGIYAASKAALHSWTDALRMEVKGLGIDVMLVAPGAITSNFGNKQVESLSMPEDSLFKHVSEQILNRATLSQRPDHSMPASALASGIVTRALRPHPAAYYSAGGKSFLFAILAWMPRWIVWRILSRALGADKVGVSKKKGRT